MTVFFIVRKYRIFHLSAKGLKDTNFSLNGGYFEITSYSPFNHSFFKEAVGRSIDSVRDSTEPQFSA